MKEKLFSTTKPRENWDKYFSNNDGLIIDLGCGYGADSFVLANKGYKVIAVDENENLKYHSSNMIFKKQKIEQLIDDESDGVIANFSLHYLLPKIRLETIKHYLKSLKPGGIFYILIFDKCVTLPFLECFPEKPQIEYFTIEDNHPPSGEHLHKVAKVVYRKSEN